MRKGCTVGPEGADAVAAVAGGESSVKGTPIAACTSQLRPGERLNNRPDGESSRVPRAIIRSARHLSVASVCYDRQERHGGDL